MTPLNIPERQTAQLICEGYTMDTVAKMLSVHINTVKYRISRIKDKLGLPDSLPMAQFVWALVSGGHVDTGDLERQQRIEEAHVALASARLYLAMALKAIDDALASSDHRRKVA